MSYINNIVLSMITITLFSISFTQSIHFNLSDYKLPDLKRRSLQFNIDLSATYDYYKIPYLDDYPPREGRYKKYLGKIFFQYDHTVNNSEYQQQSAFRLDIDARSYPNNRTNNNLYDNSYFSPTLNYTKIDRKYFGRNNFEEMNFISHYVLYLNNNSGQSVENRQKIQILSISIPIKRGRGRIEPVQDARHAVYLFEELSNVGRLTSDKSDEDIIEFAKLISRLKNERFFDSRLRKIAEIEAVDSFFVSKNYVIQSDAKYFSILSDIWSYGRRPVRLSGKRISATILPGYNLHNNLQKSNWEDYYSQNIEEKSGYITNTFTVNAGIEFNYEKPINLYWQNSIDISGYCGIIDSKTKEVSHSSEMEFRAPNILMRLHHTIGYYPNTRTYFTASYDVQYVSFFNNPHQPDHIMGSKGNAKYEHIDLNAYYYISPKLTLRMNASFYYLRQHFSNGVYVYFEENPLSTTSQTSLSVNPVGQEYPFDKMTNSTISLNLNYDIF
ncbi:MAG: hypothetical protein HQ510_12935 [Candidatus Marinimicrobia bacterium]|nr:hypothetical protein [Candidatus Neomarinimicrobiota bacterium]